MTPTVIEVDSDPEVRPLEAPSSVVPAPQHPPPAQAMNGQSNHPEQSKGAEQSKEAKEAEERSVLQELDATFADSSSAEKLRRLKNLLSRSELYAKIMQQKMQSDKANRLAKLERKRQKLARQQQQALLNNPPPSSSSTTTTTTTTIDDTIPDSKQSNGHPNSNSRSTRKRKSSATNPILIDDDDDATHDQQQSKSHLHKQKEKGKEGQNGKEGERERKGRTIVQQNVLHPGQSALVTGAKLRDYQKIGVEWLLALDSEGISGILADEMGLGKTLQTITFLATLMETGTWGPFLIVCPLSVLQNWINEFKRFTPSVKVVKYHGTPDERAEIRQQRMSSTFVRSKKAGDGIGSGTGSRPDSNEAFPVVVTTYEIIMKDREYLSKVKWRYIVVDEGHRLKNLDCKLIRELKSYHSANRLILTGTPLHNNLAELWSLLNFILPELFDDLHVFQQWFDFSSLSQSDSEDAINSNNAAIVASLHEILRPFLLRRLKVDVEKDLPPKKEYLLYAPLTAQQKELYDVIIRRDLRRYLIDLKTGSAAEQPVPITVGDGPDSDSSSAVRLRKRRKIDYDEEKDNKTWLDDLENGTQDVNAEKPLTEGDVKAKKHRAAEKEVGNLRLQNVVMQLRKICCHPYLFDWPRDPETGLEVVDQSLIAASGKLLLLDRFLTELFQRGHKVLLFSQFTKMLDILQDWAQEHKDWPICRIDGATSQDEREEQLKMFRDKDPDSPKLFLLSTRAGGLGLNLVEADTVIFFDSDWNPQMDLQAQDRAHRIGQTRPVLVFRLCTAHTIEQTILQKAAGKRKLENLVIGQGNFKTHGLPAAMRRRQPTASDLVEALKGLKEEEIDLVEHGDVIISDSLLESLLDRSKEAMSREKGTMMGTMAEVMELEMDNVDESLATRM